MFSPEGFVLPSFVMRDDLIGSIKDVTGRSVILLQFDDNSIRIVVFKFKDIADISSAPSVNALVVVTYNTQVPAV